MAQYDDFADIYDVWVASAPVTDANRRYYVERYLETEGPAVELGVGDGRIAVEAARRGKTMVGVDDSAAMLELCRARAEAAGVLERITLLQDDFRTFQLEEPAALVAIPFHTIGHMLSLDDKRACLAHVHDQLVPGGRLIFDHFVADPAYLARSGQPVLRAATTDERTGGETLLWVVTTYDVAVQGMTVRAITEELDGEGVLLRRRVRRLDFSWIEPEETRTLLEETGYSIEAAWGDFDGTPLDESSSTQLWIARRS